MKKYINIDIDYWIELYDSGKSIREIERILEKKYSFTKIYKEIKSFKFKQSEKEKYKQIEGKDLFAKCKITDKEFIDYKNSSGVLTRHLIDNIPNFKLESNFKRKQYEFENLKYWYDQYFDFIYKDKINNEVKKCKYCKWETKDINNLSGTYGNHLLNEHNVNIVEYLNKYPEDEIFFKNYKSKIDRNEILNNTNKSVKCLECGKYFKNITNTHLKNKHNMSINEYKIKHKINTLDKIYSKDYLKFLIKNRKENFFPKKINKRSKAEKEITNILEDYNLKIIINNREILDGYELDILIPSKKIAIEYNGLYYHSEISGNKKMNYHLSKLRKTNENNYNLIQIFEDEWIFKKEIVISKLQHILNIKKPVKTIYGRKCLISKIDSNTKNLFLNKNHIQGDDRSVISYGAFYGNELVSVMTFDNKRQLNKEKNHNNNIYELKRFVTKIEYNVIGIGGKLFKYFLRNENPNKIISFADLRWTINRYDNLYTKLGFTIEKILKPDYMYISNKQHRNKRLHKFNYGKNKIKKKFPEIYDKNKTEWEMMQEAGFDRIWDCGKVKYVYTCE